MKVVLSTCIAAVVAILGAQSILAQSPKRSRPIEKEEDADRPREREEWFYHQRAYPHKRIPAGARMRAVQEMDRVDVQARARRQTFEGAASITAPQSVSTSANWTSIGPQPTKCFLSDCSSPLATSGRVTALAIDPTNANTVYAGGAQGGVWKTTNGGQTWKELTDTQASLAMGSLAIDPQNHETIYAGTGEANNSGDSYYGAGILKSTDGGNTWSNIPGPFVQPTAQHIGALAVSPRSSNLVIAGADGGIYLSGDSGTTWHNVLNAAPGTGVVFDPSNPSVVYAALGDLCGDSCGITGNGVYKSSDAGNSWAKLTGSGANTFPRSGVGRIALAIAPSTPTTLYAAIQDGSQITGSNPTAPLLGVWKTTDGGSTWNPIGQPPDDSSSGYPFCGFNGQCDYDLVIQVHPQNPNLVVVGGVTLALSTDGESFNNLPLLSSNGSYSVHVDQHAIAFSTDLTKGYFGNDGGVWSAPLGDLSRASTVNFINLNEALALTQFYAGASVFPGGSNSLLGGTQDNGTQLQASSVWNNVSSGDGGYTAVDVSFPTLFYGVYPSASAGFNVWLAYDLQNEGPFPNPANYGIDPSDRTEFTPPLAMDPVNPAMLYFGTYRVYRSMNSAGQWTAISPDLTGGSQSDEVTVIAVSPADSNVVYAGTGNGKVQMTTNALGASPSWSNRTPNLPNRYVTGIAGDTVDAMTAYVVLSGIPGEEDTPGHVFKTTNGGGNWTDISGNLPNTPINWVVVDPDVPDTLYAASDVGVQVTTNGGGSWTTLGNGLPRVAVLSLTLDRQTRTLYAGTHGRSMWSIALPLSSPSLQPLVSSLSPSTVSAGSGAFTLTVTGSNFASGTTLLWNGISLSTTVSDSDHLSVTVPANDTATGGRASLVAFNSTGGASAPANFNIGPAPTNPSGGIVSAAGNVKGVAPGMLGSLYGTGLAGKTTNAPGAPLPSTLGQTTLLEDGETLPLIFVSAGQIDFQVSWFQVPGTPTVFQVINGAQASPQSTYTVVPFAPAIFTLNEAGTGQGAILIANTATFAAPAGQVPGASSRPAKRGEFVEIYASGLGQVDAAASGNLNDGDPAPSNPPAKTLTKPTLTIGGVPVSSTVAGYFSGLAPGFVGLNQINVPVPANAPTGNAVNVQITMVDTSVTPNQTYLSNIATMAIQ